MLSDPSFRCLRLKQCTTIDALMIVNFDGTTFEAELLFTDAGHEVAPFSPLDETTAPGTLLEAFLLHLFS